ncbi:hemicentin-1-like isoform X1 [Pyxicephalus adspersus]|uniref:hemicentin-1-like isoform X1 n=1 Tax=Pyxicephalus adspersus TaxID=30357 RepID=UPI003B597FD0
MGKGNMDRIGVRLACVLLLLIQYGNGAELIIITPDSSPTPLIGDTINLNIIYDKPPNTIVWLFNDNIIAIWISNQTIISPGYQNRLIVKPFSCTISDSTFADSGKYVVNVTATNGDFGSLSFSVLVKEKVLEITSNDTGKFRTGENISLNIQYEGNPIYIFWRYNGTTVAFKSGSIFYVVPKFKDRLILDNRGSLLIYNTTIDDAGNYTVTVETSFAPGSLSFQVMFSDLWNVTVLQTPPIINESSPDVILTCSATSGSGSVTWQKDGQPINIDSTHIILDKVLQILNPKRTDTGNYSCNMTDMIRWDVGSIIMTVYYPIENVTITQFPQIVSENTPTVNLSCSASSGPIETVTWMKNGQAIDHTYILLDGNFTLQLIQPKREFIGNYSCNLSNAAYSNTGYHHLHVNDPIENVTITQFPQTVSENTSAVNLSCSASSGPIETVTWMKNGQAIDHTYILLDGNFTLQLIQPKREFSGNYSCNLSNPAYSNTGYLQLLVYDPLENVVVTQLPQIVSENTSDVNLSCTASSGYIETAMWMKNGQAINHTHMLFNGNMTLQLIKPKKEFSGDYSCNLFNAVYWGTGSLSIRVYDPVENVTVTQLPTTVSEMTSLVTLSCNASSGYTEAVTWIKDGNIIVNENNTFNLLDGNHTLQIIQPNRTFSGKYSCNISNAVYMNSSYLQLLVHEPFENVTVTGPAMVEEGVASASLTCSASSGNTEAVTWLKDGESLPSVEAYSLLDENQTLQITKPDRTFTGNYTCILSNAAYEGSGSLYLNVTYTASVTTARVTTARVTTASVSYVTASATSTIGLLIMSLLGGILVVH